MRRIIFSLLILVSLAACDKAKKKTDESLVASPLFDSATISLRASKFVEGMQFGDYSVSSVPNAAPQVLGTDNSAYFNFDAKTGLQLSSNVTDILNSDSYSIVMTIELSNGIGSLEYNLFNTSNLDRIGDNNSRFYSYIKGILSDTPNTSNVIYNHYSIGLAHVTRYDKFNHKAYAYGNDFNTQNFGTSSTLIVPPMFSGKTVLVYTFQNMNDFSSTSIKHFSIFINGVEQTSLSGGFGTFTKVGEELVASWGYLESLLKLASTQNLYIGYQVTAASASTETIPDYLRPSFKCFNFGIFNKALSADEVSQLYEELK
jgi:hypothetical protein